MSPFQGFVFLGRCIRRLAPWAVICRPFGPSVEMTGDWDCIFSIVYWSGIASGDRCFILDSRSGSGMAGAVRWRRCWGWVGAGRRGEVECGHPMADLPLCGAIESCGHWVRLMTRVAGQLDL